MLLEQLDRAAESFVFPGPPNLHYRTAAMRLSAFGGRGRWLVTFEDVAYSRREGLFIDTVSAFGSERDNPGHAGSEIVLFSVPGKELVTDDLALSESVQGPEVVVALRGAQRSLQLRPAPKSPEDVLLLAVAQYRAELFLTPDELLAKAECPPIPLLFQTDRWQHPDPIEGDAPSSFECFQTLARAIDEGDASLFSCPEELVNTDWSRWDDTGFRRS